MVRPYGGVLLYKEREMKDIEYEKGGVKKMAQERFKAELEAVGWKVVQKPVKKPAKKKED